MDADDLSNSPTFGGLLREHRLAPGLSQEALAEQAGVSRRGISDLERGARTHAHHETVTMLAAALGLDGRERAAFMQRARRPVGRAASSHRQQTGLPFPRTPLIGRERELAAICELLHRDDVLRWLALGLHSNIEAAPDPRALSHCLASYMTYDLGDFPATIAHVDRRHRRGAGLLRLAAGDRRALPCEAAALLEIELPDGS